MPLVKSVCISYIPTWELLSAKSKKFVKKLQHQLIVDFANKSFSLHLSTLILNQFLREEKIRFDGH